ncbi:sodium-dependent lysophosphatidylcholine symporter 1 [Protopterus annectens]|uniref:sodium-dependent lysophosphatidylcholine symporter 1 n=1 Tax=Protopterus annectens TaxID=7888 RepID=UPI001CFAF088|nr:sodium-dependent lysophosphatidylcholine symporter 1 [Protopterus annectens]
MAKGEGGENCSAKELLKSPEILNSDHIKLDKNNGKPMLSVCNKICYAIGGAPYQITGSAIGFFLQIYLLDVTLLDPFNASIILFVGRAWDAITDPTVGFFVSRSKWMKFGRLLPWIVMSTPFAVTTYLLMWYVPNISTGKLFWYLIFYCLFQTLMTCFHVPYSALTMFISNDQTERDSATAYRMTVEVLGTVLGTAIQGQIVGNSNAPCIASLELNLTVSSEEINITHQISLEQTRKAYMIAAGVICIIYVICAAVLFYGVQEIRDTHGKSSKRAIPFFQGLKMVMQHGPYVKLILGFLFTSLAFMLLEGNFALFCIYTLGFRDHFQNILLLIMLSATLTIPFWQWFLSRFGKKTSCYIGISSAIPFLILIVTIKSNLVVAYLVSVAAGVSVAAAFLLSWSMLPDVIDDFNLKYPDYPGLEAIFYSFYVFFTKFASGVSLGVSTLSLDFAGYLTRGCVQPNTVDTTLKILVCPLPVALILVGLFFFKLYPIDEETRRKNKKLLEDLRINESDTDSSDTYSNKSTPV